MPTKRNYVGRRQVEHIDRDVHYLVTGEPAVPPCRAYFLQDRARTLWNANRAELLAEWITDRPGSRPWAWWKWDAPEPRRRRLGGTGRPWASSLSFGLPTYWRRAGEMETLLAAFEPIDPADPPTFESQAAYLDRLGLLVEGERERLTKRDFSPEIITLED